MAVSSVFVGSYAPFFSIVINNTKLPAEVSFAVKRVQVTQQLNQSNDFNFVVQDESQGGQFIFLGREPFKIGNEVTIAMGYTGRVVKVGRGKINNISAEFSQGMAPSFTVEGADSAYHFLKAPRQTEEFTNKTDSQIVRAIASRANMVPEVDDVDREPTPRKFKKGGKSYFDFITDLASDNGYEFHLAGTRLYFRPADRRRAPMMALGWGETLISFRPVINTANAVTQVIVRGWDRQRRRTIEATVNAGDEERTEEGGQLGSEVARGFFGEVTKEITDRPVNSVEEARNIGLAELQRSSDSFITGSAETVGMPELQVGEYVSLTGLGEWFSGKYYIDKITHRLDQSGYQTSLELKRNSL